MFGSLRPHAFPLSGSLETLFPSLPLLFVVIRHITSACCMNTKAIASLSGELGCHHLFGNSGTRRSSLPQGHTMNSILPFRCGLAAWKAIGTCISSAVFSLLQELQYDAATFSRSPSPGSPPQKLLRRYGIWKAVVFIPLNGDPGLGKVFLKVNSSALSQQWTQLK